MKIHSKVPLWLALIFYTLVTAWLYTLGLLKTGGHLGYPLDDTYIHMAMAKHLVNHGIWGVSVAGFSSSSSSILWTLMVAGAYRLVGIQSWVPMLMGYIAGLVAVACCYRLLRSRLAGIWLAASLAFIILLSPLPILALLGMEHLLHGLLSVGIVFLAAESFAAEQNDRNRMALLGVLSMLVASTRYEGLFLVAVCAFFYFLARRFLVGLLLIAAGLTPIIIYGLFSLRQGSFFLPNSLIIKGSLPLLTSEGVLTFLQSFAINFFGIPQIAILVITLSLFYWMSKKIAFSTPKDGYLIGIFVLMALVHVTLAKVGWFYRYEAYILFTGSVVAMAAAPSLIAALWKKYSSREVFFFLAVIVVLYVPLLMNRPFHAFQSYPYAVKNIYEQQYQMGRFVKAFYEGRAVALNDIGAVNYLSDVHTLDLYGIASVEVTMAKRRGRFEMAEVRDLVQTNEVDAVIIYQSWFPDRIPPGWVEVARWRIAQNVVCGSDTVSFYAPDPPRADELRENLSRFSPTLPPGVEVFEVWQP